MRVSVRQPIAIRVGAGVPARRLAVRARATAQLSPAGGDSFGYAAQGSGGGYDGPLAYRMGKPMRPDVADAFDRMGPGWRDAVLPRLSEVVARA